MRTADEMVRLTRCRGQADESQEIAADVIRLALRNGASVPVLRVRSARAAQDRVADFATDDRVNRLCRSL
ncbi:hypothetical protein B0I33_101231 [Prauserella shujinwangii]|uniref:Uncharacterized protein n=1 Tax=Prauserella shujinwangii TaxID=1453103 RepID=A0A2T0M2V5_9PSEU|nr:hypothetical protein [Prauserella shujinwangii]PRX51078.1 hypothetical protein B0I33_101231 [Prauserella shujinwangii]